MDYVVEKVGRGLLGSYDSLSEVVRRRRFTTSAGDQFVEKLFGVEITADLVDRGSTFISGVLDRADEVTWRVCGTIQRLSQPRMRWMLPVCGSLGLISRG
ncbi:MAG: hypothetical protein Ct9H300mP26_0300 [Acidimicrobiales bacterium]|nr:MAG: hypothetical protein Ct9H300mP26_0300 [Acidimicrobiales bacterium]